MTPDNAEQDTTTIREADRPASPRDEAFWAGRCEGHQIDGDCHKPTCPQKRDGEPAKTRRICPIWAAQGGK